MKTFIELGTEIGDVVERKNAAYGSSFAKAGPFLRMLYPGGLRVEQFDDALLLVRIFDKLQRIATDRDALGESPYRDIAGYGILGAHLHESLAAGLGLKEQDHPCAASGQTTPRSRTTSHGASVSDQDAASPSATSDAASAASPANRQTTTPASAMSATSNANGSTASSSEPGDTSATDAEAELKKLFPAARKLTPPGEIKCREYFHGHCVQCGTPWIRISGTYFTFLTTAICAAFCSEECKDRFDWRFTEATVNA